MAAELAQLQRPELSVCRRARAVRTVVTSQELRFSSDRLAR